MLADVQQKLALQYLFKHKLFKRIIFIHCAHEWLANHASLLVV